VELTITVDCPRGGQGCGGVRIDPGQDTCDDTCRSLHRLGSELTLVPQPADGYFFVTWRGACEDPRTDDEQLTPCRIAMDEPQEVTAVFAAIPG
jgi:hypothetical protein